MFISPLMFINHGNGVNMREFLVTSMGQLTLFTIFYMNYLWLTPKLFTEGTRKYYWIVNIVVIIALGIGLHYWMFFNHSHNRPPFMHPERPNYITDIFLISRNIFNLTVSAAIATTVKLAMRWQAAENARREAEAARAQAELKSLRSQINPHFLLNTLNNIYALTAFNAEKAQKVILELSKMLRYMLYDNQQQYVNLEKEIQFLTNYINLMKIRLSDDVDVQLNVDIPHPCNIMIAPLIFISLVENAFKHGVSTTKPSFIHITINGDNEKIVCNIENSNHPKAETDRSGHGIGLKQVASRLQLAYPGKYEWTKGVDETRNIYSSKITIYDTELCNN